MKPFSAMPAYQEIIDVLRSAVSDTGLIADPSDISAAALDGRGRRQGEALAVVRPASTEVSLVMKTAAAYGLSVIPQGGNTSNVGGATPEPGASAETARRTLILQLGHMKRILNVSTVNNTITLEAGVVLQDAQKAASDAGRLLPLSLAAEGSREQEASSPPMRAACTCCGTAWRGVRCSASRSCSPQAGCSTS